jgi:hypothetical protein
LGLSRLDTIEKVHLAACKRFLGVSLCTPNKMIYSELGRFPLFINPTLRSLRYWFRLVQLDESRLPAQAYRMLFNLDIFTLHVQIKQHLITRASVSNVV